MIPVDQTDTSFESGNCFSAVIASLLQIDLAEVPTFFFAEADVEACWANFQAWASARGFSALEVGTGPEEPWRPNEGQWCWLVGPSPRNPDRNHAVVGRWTGDRYEVVHDPHPSRAGLPAVEVAGFLIPVDPTRGGETCPL